MKQNRQSEFDDFFVDGDHLLRVEVKALKVGVKLNSAKTELFTRRSSFL